MAPSASRPGEGRDPKPQRGVGTKDDCDRFKQIDSAVWVPAFAGTTESDMSSPRLATYSIDDVTGYGAVVDNGIVDLSARYGKDYPTLREVIAAGALSRLADDAAHRSPDHPLGAITWLPPIPVPEKIICIGVNYPDRNAEYEDGQDAPKYPSMFMRPPRSFVGHNTPLVRPRASQQLDYEGEVVLVIGKPGRHVS